MSNENFTEDDALTTEKPTQVDSLDLGEDPTTDKTQEDSVKTMKTIEGVPIRSLKKPRAKPTPPLPSPSPPPPQNNAVADIIEESEQLKTAPPKFLTTDATDFHDLVPKKVKVKSSPKQQRSRKLLKWSNVTVEQREKNGTKGTLRPILNNVSGHARAGELTFIMGSSGAGKTTLLNVLTGRNKGGLDVSGQIHLNGHVQSPQHLKRTCAYIQQEDMFIANQTVSEVLHFAVKMRSPEPLPKSERTALVQSLLALFALKQCENTQIGSLKQKGISRGEKKRLAFACEYLTDPPVLFCDEPTTGLDSFMSHQVMSCLKRLATAGKIVVCTIHQPSTWVYQMADRLVLLCQGRVAYEGRTANVGAFLERIGSPLPEFASISDHLIRVLSQSVKEKPLEYDQRIEKILSQHEPPDDSFQQLNSVVEKIAPPRVIYRSWCFQFLALVSRGLLQISRRRKYIAARLFLTILVSWFLGMVYLQVPIHKDNLLGIKGVIFASLQMNNILYMMPSLISFWEDYPVVIRESQSNMYSPSAYFMARSFTDSILHMIFPIVFFVIIYFMTGLPITFIAISTFLIMSISMSMIITSLCHAVVSMCGNVNTALSVAPLISIPVMVFGGFLITVDSVPRYYKPLGFISWYHYAFEAIMIAVFEKHGEIKGCSTNTKSLLPKQFDFECSTGLKFINDQDFEVGNFWWDFTAIGIILVFWKMFGLVSFVLRIRIKT